MKNYRLLNKILVCLIFFSCDNVIDSEENEQGFITLHGIDINSDLSHIYVSGRGDDKLHVFDLYDGSLIRSIPLGDNAMSAGIKYYSGKIYVTLQALDQVAIINAETYDMTIIDINYSNSIIEHNDQCMGKNENECNDDDVCMWMMIMSMCMESGSMMNMGNETPHFIQIDEVNRYWFVTTITSGYIGRYSLDTNEFIDKILIGDSPALMSIDKINSKLYVSRMMPMAGMMTGSESTIIQQIDYSSANIMITDTEFEIGSPAPHGLTINSIGSTIYTTSNTADWLWKIDVQSNNMESVVMDSLIDNAPNVSTQRLKPIQCLSVNDSLLFITCSAGLWYNSNTGIHDTIPGQIQMWNTNSMSLLDTLQFSWTSKPWHIVNSNNTLYVSLAGDNLFSRSSGVASIKYDENNLQVLWLSY